MFITFVAFCALAMTSAFVNFRHQVKKHETDSVKVSVPVQEDAALKARGIRLPGYNH